MFKAIARFFRKTYGAPTAGDIARKNLEEYQSAYLKCQCDAAYNLKLAEFYREGIERMRQFTPVGIPQQLQLPE